MGLYWIKKNRNSWLNQYTRPSSANSNRPYYSDYIPHIFFAAHRYEIIIVMFLSFLSFLSIFVWASLKLRFFYVLWMVFLPYSKFNHHYSCIWSISLNTFHLYQIFRVVLTNHLSTFILVKFVISYFLHIFLIFLKPSLLISCFSKASFALTLVFYFPISAIQVIKNHEPLVFTFIYFSKFYFIFDFWFWLSF